MAEKPLNTGLLKQISQAEIRLQASLQELEQPTIQRVDVQSEVVRAGLKETIENPPTQVSVEQRIENMQLRLELLRNIRMNWNTFQASLAKKDMSMRINQDAHMRHLIAFLETGKGVETDYDKADPEAVNDPARALMTFEVQPTGAGKTGAFAIDIALMDVPSLTLVPFDSLLGQTKRDLLNIGGLPENEIGIVGGGEKDIGRKHTVATYAGHLALMKKGGEYAKFMRSQCKLVICDEVHHHALGDQMQASITDIDSQDEDVSPEEQKAMLEAEQELFANLNEDTSVKSLKIGFTATPKGSKKHVQKYFPHCLGRVYYREMIKAGYVVPYEIVHCDGTIYAGELEQYLSEEDEVKILTRENIYNKLLGEYAEVLSTYKKTKLKKKDYPMRGMAFCTNHQECQKFAIEAAKYGLRCKIVTGKEAKGSEGQKIIDAAVKSIEDGECDLLVTVEKLATGFDWRALNSVIWARITSAAKTIQGIGRGGRAYTDEKGRMKTHCNVFETNWKLQGKKGRTPMRLADALAFNGEDPEAICKMADGTELKVNRRCFVDQDGCIELDFTKNDSNEASVKRMAVSIVAYARSMDVVPETLEKFVQKAGLIPVSNVNAYNKNSPVKVFWKDEVDAVIPKYMNKNGVVLINGVECVGISPYARAIKISPNLLRKCVENAKLQKVSDTVVLSGHHTMDVYLKSEVDSILPKRLGKSGIVDVNGRLAIGVKPYGKQLKMAGETLHALISEAGLQRLPILAFSGPQEIDLFWKDEVDPLLPKKLENGMVLVNDRFAVSPNGYLNASGIKMSGTTLIKAIKEAGLQPIPPIRISGGPFDLYWKDEVDSLLRSLGKF